MVDPSPAPQRTRWRSRHLRSLRSQYVAVVVASMLIGVIAFGLESFLPWNSAQPSSTSQGTVQTITVLPARVAMPLKPVQLPDLASADQSTGSAQITGRVAVVNIWASWCVACRAEAATLERAWRDYHSRGVQFMGIDTRDTRPAGIAFERKYGVSFPSGFDHTGSIGAEYGLMGVPNTLIVGPHHTVRFLIYGALDGASFRQALDTALALK